MLISNSTIHGKIEVTDAKEKELLPVGKFKAVQRYKPNPRYGRKTFGKYGFYTSDSNRQKTIKFDEFRFEMSYEGKLYWLPMVAKRLEGTKTLSKIGKKDLDNYFPNGITNAYKDKNKFTFLYAPKYIVFKYFESNNLIKA